MTRIDQIEEEIKYLQRIETEGSITNYGKGRLDALKEGLSLVKNLDLLNVSGSYEFDFGTHCRARIDITNNEPKVVGAMNGWGDGISLADIKIKKL